MIYIGIDNGVTGSIGIVVSTTNYYEFHHTPVKNELSYTKAKKWIDRIDWKELKKILSGKNHEAIAMVALERPMVDPRKFVATQSAMRSLESTLIVIESLKLPFRYIDSREWQKTMLPSGLKGTEELKKASLDIGKRLFPLVANKFKKDADGILIAEHLRRINAS